MAHGDGRQGSAGDGTDSGAPSQAQGTLVIRTWWEPDHVQGFRARVTSQLPESGQTTVTTADPEEVLAVVRRWLLARPGTANQ
ncbi:MAG TPA: hypothetical protein VIQ52_10070 [Arthrobacter sp.]